MARLRSPLVARKGSGRNPDAIQAYERIFVGQAGITLYAELDDRAITQARAGRAK